MKKWIYKVNLHKSKHRFVIFCNYNAIAAAQFLEELLGCKVDLICDYKNLSPFFRKQIENNGIDIFSAA